VEAGRDGALGGRQIGVPGGHGQAISLPHRWRAGYCHRNIEVAGEPADHLKLLPVLLAEHRHIRQALQQQLGHYRRHALEMAWPIWAAEMLCQSAAYGDLSSKAFG